MAASQELIDYIRESLKFGKSLTEIENDLSNEGWSQEDIEEGVYEAGSQQQEYQQPQYAPQQQQPQQYPQSYGQQNPFQQTPVQYNQPIAQPYDQPQQLPAHVKAGIPLIGTVFSMVAVVVLFLDVAILKSREWIDVFSSLSVVDTNEFGIGVLVLLIIFGAGIALGGVISTRRKPLPAGLLVLLLSVISLLTFSGLISGLVGLVAGFIVLLGK